MGPFVSGEKSSSERAEARVYSSKSECMDALTKSLDRYAASFDEAYHSNTSYTLVLNSWYNATFYLSASCQITNTTRRGRDPATARCRRSLTWSTLQGPVVIEADIITTTVKAATNEASWRLMYNFRNTYKGRYGCPAIRKCACIPRVQMDSEADVSGNTIMVHTGPDITAQPEQPDISLDEFVTSEKISTYDDLVNRWVYLEQVSFSTSDAIGKVIFTCVLPEFLYTQMPNSPALLPFQTHAYANMDFEVRLVVPGNDAFAGFYTMGVKHDSYQCKRAMAGHQSEQARRHVEVDLSEDNDAVLYCPYIYHTPFIRLLNAPGVSKGVRPAESCSITVMCVAPLAVGENGPSSITGTLYIRMPRAHFAGLTARAVVQMLGITDVIAGAANGALRSILGKYENAYDVRGRAHNRDKPSDTQSTIAIPHPAMNFATGKGPINVVSLRLNPYTQTNYDKIEIPQNDPSNYWELARKWGYYKQFEWRTTDAVSAVLAEFFVDPSCRNNGGNLRPTTYRGEPTPLEYAMTNFQFWSGTIEVKLRFIANKGHSGEVMIGTEFNRVSEESNMSASSCSYSKYYPLSSGNVCEYTIPYVYDTIMRRSTVDPLPLFYGLKPDPRVCASAIGIAAQTKAMLKIRVSTPLRCSPVVAKEVKCIIYIRAGEDFAMHGIKPASMRHFWEYNTIKPIDNFPGDYPTLLPGGGYSRDRIVKRNPPAIEMTSRELVAIARATGSAWNEMPRTQMDAVAQDDTPNFRVNRVNTQLQTLDCHMDFKDRLRMPCLITRATIDLRPDSDTATAFFIPLMPPNRSMINDPMTHIASAIFNPGVQHTAQYNICNMFRMWRGSMRYTILVRNGATVYVSYMPHTGARIIGNHAYIQKATSGDNNHISWSPLEGVGMVTEVIVPAVNPMLTFEVPYDTENVWTLMQEDNPGLSYSWRDKGNYNSGHLILSSEVEAKVTVWWSAGDDFQVANFHGIPYCIDYGQYTVYTDENGVTKKPASPAVFLDKDPGTSVRSIPKTQMDTITGAINNVIQSTSPTSVARMALGAIPIVGGGLVAASAVNELAPEVRNAMRSCSNLSNALGQSVPKIDQAATSLERLASGMSSSVDEFKGIIKAAVDKVISTTSSVASYARIFFDLFLDIVSAWVSKSWVVVGVSVVRFISHFFDTSQALALSAFGPQLGAFYAQLNQDTPTTQGPPSNESTLTGILAGIVGTLMGVYIDPKRVRSVPGALLERITNTSGISYLLSILRYVQSTFEIIKEYVMHALGYVSPEACALKMLADGSEQIAHFIREAQIVTSEASTSLLSNGNFRLRCWKTVLSAYQYQRLLCSVPSGVGNAQLAKLCSDVIKVANERFADLSASPVRYEPYVLCIEGAPGIGKSSACEEIVVQLLKSIGYQCPSSASIYYRTAGEKFWSGYSNQPVIVYDEFLNSQDSQRCNDMIVELNKLKSTSLFIPEMAHLEEKKRRGNPLVVIILCNGAFPNLANYARYPEAIYRRRDTVLRAELAEEYRNVNLRDLPIGSLNDFPHLMFRRYPNVKDGTVLDGAIRSFSQTVSYLQNTFQRYHATEVANVQKRMDRLLSSLSSQDVREIQLNDPFTLFYQLNTAIREDESLAQNAFTPYEELEIAVSNIVNQVSVAPAPENPSQPEAMPWELPRQQNLGHTILGLAIGSGMWKTVAKYSMKALRSISDYYVNKTSNTVSRCNVCLDTRVVAYACSNSVDLESPHYLCTACYNNLMAERVSGCPTCRDGVVIPCVTPEQGYSIYAAARLISSGCMPIAWLGKHLSTIYEGASLPTLTAVLYYLASLITGRLDAYESYATGHFMGFAAQAVFQSDYVDAQTTQDLMEPVVNVQLLEDLMQACAPLPVCTHGLLSNPRVSPLIYGNMWRVPNMQTNLMVDVPMASCNSESCYARSTQYATFVTRYMEANARVLRTAIVNYINNPSGETCRAVPALFRPAWVVEPSNVALPKAWWEYLTGTLHKYSYVLAGLVGATAIATIIYKICCTAQSVVALPQSDEYDSNQPHRVMRRRYDRQRQVRYFQGGEETPTPYAVAKSYIANNTFRISIDRGSNKERVLYGVGLYNHNLLLPRHYIHEIRKAMEMGYNIYGNPLHKPQLRSLLVICEKDITESTHTDIAMLKLQPSQPLFKDLRKFLATEDEMQASIPANATLFSVPRRGEDYMVLIEVDLIGFLDTYVVADEENKCFEIRDCLEYTYSRPGACGSLLLREGSNRPIMSMHVAGLGQEHKGTGYGIVLTKEALLPTTQSDIVLTKEEVEHGTIMDASIIYDMEVRLDYGGSLPKEKVPYLPQTTRLVKSLVYNSCGMSTDMQPAVLHKKDARYDFDTTPLFEGVRKHGLLTTDFTSEELTCVKEALWDGWYCAMKPLVMNPERLTVNKAITGLGIDYYKPMDLSTSMGFPYVLTRKTAKEDYITYARNGDGSVRGVEWIDPALSDEIARKELLRRNGIIPETLYIDTLKDEKRSLEKIKKRGGTRVICNPGADYTIACRQTFSHFVASFMSARRNLMHGVGCNPLSEEWSDMIKRLARINTKFITIDYSNFGPGYNAGVAKAAYSLMIDWTKNYVQGVDETEMWSLVYECIQSKHICHNTVYSQLGGSPSGAFFTTIVNSMVNQMYIMLAWKSIVGGNDWVETFKANVALIVYGDDAIMTVSDDYIGDFNGITIHQYFASHNIVSTSAEKTAAITAWVHMSEASFLKRKFVLHPTRKGEFLSPLAWESIVSTTQWVWKGASLKDSTRVNCEAALLQAHGHGPDKYKRFKDVVNRALVEAKITPITRQWADIDDVFYGHGVDIGKELNLDSSTSVVFEE